MDVLKVLAFNNDRGARKTVISSVVNYFLDPNGDQGIGGALLANVLDSLAKEVPVLNPGLVASIRDSRAAKDTTVVISAEMRRRIK
jgi:hypothetical protein